MKLSEALRKSVEMGLPYVTGDTGYYNTQPEVGYCAMGAAYAVAGFDVVNHQYPPPPCCDGNPLIPTYTPIPYDGKDRVGPFNVVCEMNKRGHSREEIATYLERFDL